MKKLRKSNLRVVIDGYHDISLLENPFIPRAMCRAYLEIPVRHADTKRMVARHLRDTAENMMYLSRITDTFVLIGENFDIDPHLLSAIREIEMINYFNDFLEFTEESINSEATKLKNGKDLFEIFVPERLRWTFRIFLDIFRNYMRSRNMSNGHSGQVIRNIRSETPREIDEESLKIVIAETNRRLDNVAVYVEDEDDDDVVPVSSGLDMTQMFRDIAKNNTKNNDQAYERFNEAHMKTIITVPADSSQDFTIHRVQTPPPPSSDSESDDDDDELFKSVPKPPPSFESTSAASTASDSGGSKSARSSVSSRRSKKTRSSVSSSGKRTRSSSSSSSDSDGASKKSGSSSTRVSSTTLLPPLPPSSSSSEYCSSSSELSSDADEPSTNVVVVAAVHQPSAPSSFDLPPRENAPVPVVVVAAPSTTKSDSALFIQQEAMIEAGAAIMSMSLDDVRSVPKKKI